MPIGGMVLFDFCIVKWCQSTENNLLGTSSFLSNIVITSFAEEQLIVLLAFCLCINIYRFSLSISFYCCWRRA